MLTFNMETTAKIGRIDKHSLTLEGYMLGHNTKVTLKPRTSVLQSVRYNYTCFPRPSCDEFDLNGSVFSSMI